MLLAIKKNGQIRIHAARRRAYAPTAVAIDLQESIRHDGGKAASAGGEVGDFEEELQHRRGTLFIQMFFKLKHSSDPTSAGSAQPVKQS